MMSPSRRTRERAGKKQRERERERERERGARERAREREREKELEREIERATVHRGGSLISWLKRIRKKERERDSIFSELIILVGTFYWPNFSPLTYEKVRTV
jgi:hypothetical protein